MSDVDETPTTDTSEAATLTFARLLGEGQRSGISQRIRQ